MQLRCLYCKTPFALRREEALVALQQMSVEKITHFDAHCPRCRRANRIPRQQLERYYPGWQQAVKELEKEAALVDKAQTGAPDQKEQKQVQTPRPVQEANKAAGTQAGMKAEAGRTASKPGKVPGKPASVRSSREKPSTAAGSTASRKAPATGRVSGGAKGSAAKPKAPPAGKKPAEPKNTVSGTRSPAAANKPAPRTGGTPKAKSTPAKKKQ